MNKLFTEFENENSLRSYPFASGCSTKDTSGEAIGIGVIVDAVLYPVNPTGPLYLSKIGSNGVVSISDDKHVVMTAVMESGSQYLEFYDTSDMHRHVGTVVAASYEALASLVNVYKDRKFRGKDTEFAASSVFPVVNDGVLSVNVSDTGAVDGDVVFSNGSHDVVRVSTNDEGNELRFDVIPNPPEYTLTSIKHIYCIVDGKTPFRIEKIPYGDKASGLGNTVSVYLDNIDRQDICGNAHREDAVSETRDTCDCEDSSCSPEYEPPIEIPDVYQEEVVDIENGADGAFYLAVPNMTGYDNPLSLTLVDGATAPISDLKIKDNAIDEKSIINGITAKGVILQVPGLEK